MTEPALPTTVHPDESTRIAGVRGVVFDLDGTLIDSYEAIADSVNHARAAHGLSPMTDGEVRRRVGRGLESLIADVIGPYHVTDGVRLFRERYAEVFRLPELLARELERLDAAQPATRPDRS